MILVLLCFISNLDLFRVVRYYYSVVSYVLITIIISYYYSFYSTIIIVITRIFKYFLNF